jgi:thioredoxin 1
MSEKLIDLKEADFDQAIQNGVTLVDFWATWCGPCMMQTPILEKVAEKLEGKATIAKINVDEEQNLAARFGVQSIPTLILFKDGRQVQKMVGMQSEQALVSALESA